MYSALLLVSTVCAVVDDKDFDLMKKTVESMNSLVQVRAFQFEGMKQFYKHIETNSYHTELQLPFSAKKYFRGLKTLSLK